MEGSCCVKLLVNQISFILKISILLINLCGCQLLVFLDLLLLINVVNWTDISCGVNNLIPLAIDIYLLLMSRYLASGNFLVDMLKLLLLSKKSCSILIQRRFYWLLQTLKVMKVDSLIIFSRLCLCCFYAIGKVKTA